MSSIDHERIFKCAEYCIIFDEYALAKRFIKYFRIYETRCRLYQDTLDPKHLVRATVLSLKLEQLARLLGNASIFDLEGFEKLKKAVDSFNRV